MTGTRTGTGTVVGALEHRVIAGVAPHNGSARAIAGVAGVQRGGKGRRQAVAGTAEGERRGACGEQSARGGGASHPPAAVRTAMTGATGTNRATLIDSRRRRTAQEVRRESRRIP